MAYIAQRLLNRWTSQLDLSCMTGEFERVVSVHNIAKILLYREGGGILCYVCYILHNNHVLGNALLHVRKHQQDAFIYTSLLTFFCKILLARLNEIVTCKS